MRSLLPALLRHPLQDPRAGPPGDLGQPLELVRVQTAERPAIDARVPQGIDLPVAFLEVVAPRARSVAIGCQGFESGPQLQGEMGDDGRRRRAQRVGQEPQVSWANLSQGLQASKTD